ncbi:hypothetical protein PV325_006526 [Microctonus aethiopoides]|nr:hypothetical protein PV325_006526 [Microctonus aethiopoides]
MSTIVPLDAMTTESSKDYLRKVMMELQQLNTPPPLSASIYSSMKFPSKRLSGSKSDSSPAVVYNNNNKHHHYPSQIDVMDTAGTNHQQYQHQFSTPIVVPEPLNTVGGPIGFTKNQLATIYKQALESGSSMSLSALKSALESGHYPSVTSNQLQIPIPQQQLYTYHFYPLKSFMEKLQDNNGYKTLNDLIPHPPGAFHGSNKQVIINPLFMAVSSFIGMALLFMFGVIFLPRVFGEFKSRVVHDEFLNLTKTVTEAIDNYNLTTMRPKTRFSGAVVGIKTRPVPGVGGANRQRRKTQRPGEKTT